MITHCDLYKSMFSIEKWLILDLSYGLSILLNWSAILHLVQGFCTQSGMTSWMCDILDICCQPGTATLTPTQLPAKSCDLQAQWNQHISTVCTCGFSYTTTQTYSSHPVFVILKAKLVNFIYVAHFKYRGNSKCFTGEQHFNKQAIYLLQWHFFIHMHIPACKHEPSLQTP